ncbi:MAG TPA: hypothetical protein VLJ39_08515 [Tepidisphaeraceae bacterium]|jgi:hypothetical protein|nr:hypothetical protein [Tepidisphaeraceae bacterium]
MNPAHASYHSESSAHERAAGEFNQLALWMSASLAGMATAVMLARGGFFRKLLGRAGGTKHPVRKPTKERSLPMLAAAIVGSNKATIESVLGPPRAAVVPQAGVVVQSEHAFWVADTWYYPLPRHGTVTLVITFNADLASVVEFIEAPHGFKHGH